MFFSLILSGRFAALTLSATAAMAIGVALFYLPDSWLLRGALAVAVALTALGLRDLLQREHAVLRNYPILAHLRFLLEKIRPEMRQYFFEDEKNGMPFSRDTRAIVYQRAKLALDKRPFGTTYDVYADGFQWMNHSVAPAPVAAESFRVTIGGPNCTRPYSASLLNISAMSFGSLSANAILALNSGARLGGFAHDTGEGGLSIHHREGGGDIIWEIGSGYFGCRNADGSFSPERFAENASLDQVKMIEVKLSQGAKPGHGGVLPAAKVSAEIAAARGVPQGIDCVSPARHPAFATPIEMMEFIGRLRLLSSGKPVGFKLCVGHEWEFLAICKAMLLTGVFPDFIVVDGKEGGTGAAPLEFADHLGKPLREGLSFVHSAVLGIGARRHVKIGASGKIATAFDMARAFALGADWCNAARAFMFALGCIQSLSCHTDRCPTGVATQDPRRQRALVVPSKTKRVANFHRGTMQSLAELTAAAGLDHPRRFRREHFYQRSAGGEVESFADIYPILKPRELLDGCKDQRMARAWDLADPATFLPKIA